MTKMVSTCAICGNREVVELENEQHTAYLFRLLNLDLKNCKNFPSKIAIGIYCSKCERRNGEIHQLFSKIDGLFQKLEKIKTTIKNDFKASSQNSGGHDMEQIDDESQAKCCQLVRQQIGKGLDLMDSLATPEENEVWEPLSIPAVMYSDSESETGSCYNNKDNSGFRLDSLKKKYGLKDLRIVLKRLSPAQLTPTTTKKKQSSKTEQFFKCIFVDCPSGRSFRTKRQRDLHVKMFHDQVDQQKSSPLLDNKQNSTETFPFKIQLKSMLRCLFADCKSDLYFSTEQERNLHCRVSHGIGNDQSKKRTINPSHSSKEESQKKLKKKKKKEIKCIFVDCTFTGTFKTEDERDIHLKKDHNLEESALDKNPKSPEQSGGNGQVTKFPLVRIQCTVDGCTNRKFFTSEEELRVHVKRVHEGITRPYECNLCGKTYRHQKEHELHVNSVHYGIFPHICHYCGKGYTTITSLNVHLPAHTDERNFQCTRCPNNFKTSGGLLYHVRKVHTGERPYQCTTCLKRFYSSVKLKNHIKCVHNKHERPIVCPLCSKTFPITNYLTMHMRIHKKRNELPEEAYLLKNHRHENISVIKAAGSRGGANKSNTATTVSGDGGSNVHLHVSQSQLSHELSSSMDNDVEEIDEDYDPKYQFMTADTNSPPPSACKQVTNANEPSSSSGFPVDLSHFHNISQNTSSGPQDFTHLPLSVPRIFGTFINPPHSSSRQENTAVDAQSQVPVLASGNRPEMNQTTASNNNNAPSILHHQYFHIMNTFDNFHKY